jgi:hypothetical protein
MKTLKIYIVSYRGHEASVVSGEHGGYDYVSSKAHAARLKRRAIQHDADYLVEDVSTVDIEISKRGILKALNHYGGHPNNG